MPPKKEVGMTNELQAVQIQNKILIIRNQQVMIDCDLAEMYGVETKVLNQAVKRNIQRFPERFHSSSFIPHRMYILRYDFLQNQRTQLPNSYRFL